MGTNQHLILRSFTSNLKLLLQLLLTNDLKIFLQYILKNVIDNYLFFQLSISY